MTRYRFYNVSAEELIPVEVEATDLAGAVEKVRELNGLKRYRLFLRKDNGTLEAIK